MRKYQSGGKKPVKRTKTAEQKSDEALTRSLEGYAGTEYIKKQMGSPEPPGSTAAKASSTYVKKPVVKKKMAKGGSFPDLNKDGKVTKKDVLIGRGVLPKTAKKGAALKKQAAIAIAMKKAGKSPKKAKVGASMTKMANMKKGGKCKYGC